MNDADVRPSVQILPSQLQTVAGRTDQLFCEAQGVPNPTVSWTFNSTDDVISRDELLILDPVEQSHAGLYQCHAQNREGSSRASVSVTVNGENAVPISLFFILFLD